MARWHFVYGGGDRPLCDLHHAGQAQRIIRELGWVSRLH